MAKIDLLVPAYGSINPQVTHAITQLIDFSRCKCAQIEMANIAQDPNYKPNFHNPAECVNGKHDVYWAPMVSMSIVHWARNQLIVNSRKDSDYILFCDSDIVVEPDYLERLLLHGKDIIAGICTRRTDPAVPNIRQWVEEAQNYGEIIQWDEDAPLIEVDAVGTGLMLISKKALSDIALAFEPEQFIKSGNGWWFQNLWFGHYRGEIGEDLSFCWKAQRLGYGIFVDPTVQPGHLDWYAYGVKDYKPYQEERIAEAMARAKAQQSVVKES